MNAFDWFVAVTGAVLILLGFAKGAARISFGLLALVVGFFVATRFQDPVAAQIVKVGVGAGPAVVLSWAVLYLGTVAAGGFVGWVFSRALRVAKLGWADRIGGASIGVVAGALFAAALVHVLAASHDLGARALGGSLLAPYAAALADVGNRVVPDGLAVRYRDGVEVVRVLWRAERERTDRNPEAGANE